MSDYTYQFDKAGNTLETYEWDNVWWEQADRDSAPRVLYIGDSISCATRRLATAAAEDSLLFDGFGTSKAVDNPYFADSIRIFASQQRERQIILFNNGLHGWHLDDTSAYKDGYEQMIRFLLREFKDTPLMLLLTTHVASKEQDARVCVRNNVVSELAKKYNLPVIDLYTITNSGDFLIHDGVHLKPEGYQLLAKTIVNEIHKCIGV